GLRRGFAAQAEARAVGGALLGAGPRGPPRSAGPCASKRPPPRHRAAPPPVSASRTRGSKHPHVIRARPRLSPPISSARWTCSPLLWTGSMSRFPAVAGRAPRRQEEGELPRELQEERPSAVRIADREEKGCTSQEGGTTPTFPIQKQRKKLIQAVRDNSFLIVTGNTGSGKTTQLPKYLYEAGFSQHGMIGVTQPRKVAAISVAQRVAEEMKCTLGSKVGYQVRFDDCSSKIVKVTMDIHLNEMAGDILMAESVDYDYDVQDTTLDGLLILPYQQRRIFLPPPPGIRKSEALQRSGRAGRTASGKCFRIYSKDFWNQCMPDHVIPEIKRTSLTSVVLTLKCLAIHDVIRFPYLDPPNERLILEALKQLYQSGHVTRLGLSMVEFPLPPHLTCAVIKAASLDCEDLLLPIAAMLSVENVFIRPVDPEYQKEAEQRHRELAAKAGGFNDFATLAVIFEQCKSSGAPASWCQKHWIHWRCLFSAFRVEAQLRELIRKLKQQTDFPRETFEGPKHEVLRRCLCAGYFKNLHEQETKLEWIIFHEVLVTTKVYARIVCPIRYEWVRDLLPKLHELNAHDLSSVARREVREDARRKWTNKENVKQLKDGISKEVLKKMQRRNDDKSISDARARFLERKQQRTQDHSDTLKETG
ncbi:hypothetical protein U0070_003364, partial [Myodes glareolus]